MKEKKLQSIKDEIKGYIVMNGWRMGDADSLFFIHLDFPIWHAKTQFQDIAKFI